MKRALLLASVLAAVAASIIGQRSEIGRSPKEVLDPKTVKAIQTPLAQKLEQRIESEQQSTDRRLSQLSGQMQVVVEQLRNMAEAQNQIVANTQATIDLQRRMAAIESRVIQNEKDSSSDPANIAVLGTKVDGLVKVGGWLIGTTATLAVSGIVFLIKRLKSGAVVTMKWAEQDAAKKSEDLFSYRQGLLDKLDEVKERADAAYLESNNVNNKIESIGMHMNDNKPLNPQGEHDAQKG